MSSVSNISSTLRGQTYDKIGKSDEDVEAAVWRERSRIVLNPVASPSAMGLFAFSAATLIVAGILANWYGKASTAMYVAPFALAFGGIGQFLAGMWSYKARDTIATVVHTM